MIELRKLRYTYNKSAHRQLLGCLQFESGTKEKEFLERSKKTKWIRVNSRKTERYKWEQSKWWEEVNIQKRDSIECWRVNKRALMWVCIQSVNESNKPNESFVPLAKTHCGILLRNFFLWQKKYRITHKQNRPLFEKQIEPEKKEKNNKLKRLCSLSANNCKEVDFEKHPNKKRKVNYDGKPNPIKFCAVCIQNSLAHHWIKNSFASPFIGLDAALNHPADRLWD